MPVVVREAPGAQRVRVNGGTTMTSQVGDAAAGGAMPRQHNWPVRCGPVPPLARSFSPRPETGLGAVAGLSAHSMIMLTNPAAASSQPLAALGGTGKTQLAAEVAHSAWHSGTVDLLVWVPAARREAILAGYADALAHLDETARDGPADAAAARLLALLAATDRPWLVVLDDLASPADLDDLWPRGPAGRILVTTRVPPASLHGQDRTIVEVGPFSRREALNYLTVRLGEDPAQRIGAFDLAEDLCCLPLALAQAAALIADCQLSCREYRAMFASRKQHADVAPAGGYPAAAGVTWSLALERADQLPPTGLARRALTLVALLGPSGVPRAVLTSRAAAEYITGGHGGEELTVGALNNLARLGLLAVDPASTTRTVRVHALVQALVCSELPPGVLDHAARAAADALLQAWPRHDRQPLPEQALLEQALRDCTAGLHRLAAELLWAPVAHPVLFLAGQSLDDAGLTGPAISYWKSMTDASGSILGAGHAATLRACDSFAAALEAAGRREEAIGAYQQGLADREQLLGSGHPDTLAALSRLAHACFAAQWVAEAVPLYERAVAGREWVLGPDHADTLAARADLAAAYRAAGQPADAAALFRQTLADCERALAPGHPLTETIRGMLGVPTRA
jgi:Tetratricopeptide repeat